MEESQRPRYAAAQLLERVSHTDDATTGPVDVDALAEALGLDVETFHPATRRTGALGWLEPGEPLIFLRDGLTRTSRRFTLAHEIGHFLLHRTAAGSDADAADDAGGFDGSAACDVGDLDAPVDAASLSAETLRPGQAYSARARRESEANQFASYLLLPATRLLGSYQRVEASGEHAGTLRSLAEEFGVSEDVLLRRLSALLVQAPREMAEETESPGDADHRDMAALDREQRAAAHSSTPALVIAGPGTGKTSTLVGRVAYLVRERGAAPDSILALTFSNKAAGEMRERLRALLAPPEQDEDALRLPTPLPTISTIHAFCGDLLRRYAPLVGLRPDFRLMTDTEGYFLLRELSSALAMRHYQPLAAPAQHFPALLAAISRAKDELCAADEYAIAATTMATVALTLEEREAAEKALEVAEVYAAYQARLTARGDADFGDLIMLTVRLLREQPDILDHLRQQYAHVLVDEFQDINRAIGVLLRTLVGTAGPLWAVGDADQAIYRFRGASPANLAQFTSDYPGAAVHTLGRNYRSLAPVLTTAAGVASVFLEGGERLPLTAARGGADERIVTLATADTDDAEMAGLVDALRRRHDAGRPYADQAVLCRTRRHCQRIAAALSAAGVPVRMSAPLFEQDDVKDLLAIAALLADTSGAGLPRAGRVPDHAFSIADARTALREARRRGVTATALLAGSLDEITELSAEGRQGMARLGRILPVARRAPDIATGLARYVFGQTAIGTRLLASAATDGGDNRESAARVAQVLALARGYDDQQRGVGQMRGGGADWAGFLDYVRVVAALRQESGADLSDLTLVDGVRVLTVHASKGLEFPVVYLPGLADRRFPMQRQWEPAPLPPPVREQAGLGDAGAVHLAEEACLFYVGLTRARDELILSHADRYGRMRYQPSPFLAPIRDRLGSKLRLTKWSLPNVKSPVARAGERGLPDGARDETTREGAPDTDVLTISALETYARCPKQFAYRYKDGLRPREVGLSTLRRSLHATLRELHGQLSLDAQVAPPPSLDDALALFESVWREAVDGERGALSQPPLPLGETPADGEPNEAGERSGELRGSAFDDVYRRHGRDVVARVWSSLQAAPGAPDPGEESHALSPRATFDHTVTVRVHEHDIAVSLDRVEMARTHAQRSGGDQRVATRPREEPARVVRHKLGLGRDQGPDLRALLYRLAATQTLGEQVDLYQQNLTTGAVEPIDFDQRRLARLYDELDEIIAGIERGDFAARPNPMTCNSCPFLLICPT